MLSKLTKELLIIVLMFAFFGLLSCVEEPTISPVKRPFSMIRVGNLTINKVNLHVQIQDIDENVIQDLNIAKNTFTSYMEVPSGGRRFVILDDNGIDTLYNSAIDVTAYGEYTIFFSGHESIDPGIEIVARREGDTYFLNTPGLDSAWVYIVHTSGATPSDTTAVIDVTAQFTAPGDTVTSEFDFTDDDGVSYKDIIGSNVFATQYDFSFMVGEDTVSTFSATLNPVTRNYIYITGPLDPDSLGIILDEQETLPVMDK